MDAWETLRRVAADRRSGASEIGVRACGALAELTTKRDVMKAARRLLRVHPAMAPLWRALALALDEDADAVLALRDHMTAESDGVVRAAAGWAIGRRARVLTHSASGTVFETLLRAQRRIEEIVCTVSLPGGEGRPFARRLESEGFEVTVVGDAEIGRAAESATIALVGADALTEEAVVNKVGTRLVALAARGAGIPCYALAGTTKLLPSEAWNPDAAPTYEATPLDLLDAVVTERGPMSPPQIRRAAARVAIPPALLGLVR
jgi:translation initiation factor 2B subunit (eIF-2B alpha/beta/delta family)